MKFKLYAIILLICFVLGSLLFFNKEGFQSDYSDYKTIDRVLNTSGKYGYCIAGKVSCPTNLVPKVLNDDYTISGKGTTYELLCNDNDGFVTEKAVECSGNYIHKLIENYKMRDQAFNGEDLNWTTPTARQIKFQFAQFPKAFSNNYSYIPVSINEDNIEFYDKDGKLLDSLHKCEMLNNQKETDNCYFELAKAAKIAEEKAENEAEEEATNREEPKKCVANFNTILGEDVCCGQPGVVQYSSSNYICPESEPVCSNYECGKQYGTCGK
jgi:hypothetical protein